MRYPDNVAGALVVSIPVGTVNFHPAQALAVGLDGIPTIVGYFGTVGVDFNYHAYRLTNLTSVTHKQITTFNQATLVGSSRPLAVWQNNRLITMFSMTDTAQNDGIGTMMFNVCNGETLELEGTFTCDVLNGVSAVGDTSAICDSRAWDGGAGTLQLFWMYSILNTATPPNGPNILTVTFSATPAPAPVDPLTLWGSNLAFWQQSDLGVTQVAGIVSQWDDLSGNARHGTATLTKRPTIAASEINGQPAIVYDGTLNVMVQSYTRAAPGTTPWFEAEVLCQRGWTNNDQYYNDGGAGLFQGASSPRLRGINGGTACTQNASAPINSYKFVAGQFTNSVSDYFQVGLTRSVGINMGNAVGTGTVCSGAATSTPTFAAQYSTAIRVGVTKNVTFDEFGKFQRYCASKYGQRVTLG
jgi:hypothetical protein